MANTRGHALVLVLLSELSASLSKTCTDDGTKTCSFENPSVELLVLSPQNYDLVPTGQPVRLAWEFGHTLDTSIRLLIFINFGLVSNTTDATGSLMAPLPDGSHHVVFVVVDTLDKQLAAESSRVFVGASPKLEDGMHPVHGGALPIRISGADCQVLAPHSVPSTVSIEIEDGPGFITFLVDNVVVEHRYIEDYGSVSLELALPTLAIGGHVLFVKWCNDAHMVGWTAAGIMVTQDPTQQVDWLQASEACPDSDAYGGQPGHGDEGLCASVLRECNLQPPSGPMPVPEPPVTVESREIACDGLKKTVVVTHHTNRPDFIHLQHQSFVHFLAEASCPDFTYVIVYDSPDVQRASELAANCQALPIRCLQLPSSASGADTAAARVGDVLQYIWDELLTTEYLDHLAVVADGDVFMTSPYSATRILANHPIAGIRQHVEGFSYIASQLMFFHTQRLPSPSTINFSYDPVEGCDVGCSLNRYLRDHSEVRIARVHHTSHIGQANRNLHTLPAGSLPYYDQHFTIEVFDRAFLHYGSSSNWKAGRYRAAFDFLPDKTRFVFWLVRSLIAGEMHMPDHTYAYPNPHPKVFWRDGESWVEEENLE